MATDILKRDVEPMLRSLTAMHRAATFGATATALTAHQVKNIINQVHSNFNTAKSSWTALVALVGATPAAEALAEKIAPIPADIDVSLATIQTAALALINAYNNSIYASGSAAWTYSASLVDGLIDGGHSEVVIAAPLLAGINSLSVTLRDSLVALAPID